MMGTAQKKKFKSKNRTVGRREFIDHDPADVRAVVGERSDVYERIRLVKEHRSKEADRWFREIHEVMAYVTRVVNARSQEARENAAAAKAMMDEMKQVTEDEKTFNVAKVQSWEVVAARDSRAKCIKGFMVL